jgi:hypothetical protein
MSQNPKAGGCGTSSRVSQKAASSGRVTRGAERGNREVDERKPEQIRDEADHDNPMTVFHT